MSDKPSPARTVRDRAEALLRPGCEQAFATDVDSYSDVVLVGVATRQCSVVVQVDRAEWTLQGALALARLFGFEDRKPAAAIERARRAKANA